jgi:dihydroflavonol-4-reductase
MFLVTGATGFIGSHLVERLCREGRRVRCLVRHKPASGWPPHAERVDGDLTTGRGLEEALRGVDIVIHLAGVTRAVHKSDYQTGNVEAAAMLARSLAGHPARLLHVSSLAAIGPSLDGAPVTEDTPPHPISAYGRSKLEGERAVRRFKPDAIIIRPPVVYGPRDTGVFQILKAVSRRWALQIAAAGRADRWFSCVYVRDLVEGLVVASEAPSSLAGRAYFMAQAKPASWAGLAETAAEIMRVRLRVVRVPAAAAYAVGFCGEIWSRLTGRPGIVSRDKIIEALCANWTCNSGRAAADLGWNATTPLAAGLAETLAWYREAGWLKY